MTRAEIFDALKENLFLIVESARDQEVVPSVSLKDLGADSLEIVEVVSRTMKQLRVRIPRTELSKVANIEGLLDLFETAARSVASRE
jgi:acyl carrier protein